MNPACRQMGKPPFGVVAVLVTCLLFSSCATTTPLHEAATRGDVLQIDAYVKQGFSVNKQDPAGNTPLHYAYYYGQKEAIRSLTAYGADPTVQNTDGVTPFDMQRLARAEDLLRSAAQIMDKLGNWKDRSAARPIYDDLTDMDGSIVTKATVRKVIGDEDRLRVLFVAVRLGISGSEDRLNDVLHAYGDKSMAEDYLNSGSPSLYEGGRRWVEDHGYYIGEGMGSHRVAWGQF